MTPLDGLKLRLQIFDNDRDDTLRGYLDSAYDFILIYTGRDALPEALSVAQVRLAAILYQRRGTQKTGIANILPDDLHKQLNQWRVPVASRIQRRG
jgi:hypothetical protein